MFLLKEYTRTIGYGAKSTRGSGKYSTRKNFEDFYLTNLFGSMYIYITHLKARSKTARYERDSLKSSHARHLPASNYMIICTVIYLYTHSIHIRTLTDKAHRENIDPQKH